MKQKIFFIIILLFPLFGFSQLNVVISSDKTPIFPQDGDTISVCRDTIITFKAAVDLAGIHVSGANYFWDFDDGYLQNGIDADSVTHIYTTGGGYRVSLYVIDGASNKGFMVFPVKIDVAANFKYTKADIPENQNGICKGSIVGLKGKAFPEVWKDTFIYSVTVNSGILFSDTKQYSSTLSFNEFTLGNTFNDVDIDSIFINLEHSDMGNIDIKLTCPDGKSVMLKNFDATNHSYLGIPVDEDLSLAAGSGFDYYFATGAIPGIMNSDFTPTLPSQAYQPEEAFSNLNGCPLNGVWKIEVTDNTTLDNGFVFSWGILFNKNIIPEKWTFSDTLKSFYTYNDGSIAGTFWNGSGAGGTNIIVSGDTIMGNTAAIPPVYGNNKYSFYTVNNWGCPKDTFVTVRVEQASFTATPETGEAKLDVSFENTTSWGNTFLWSFGDESDDDTAENVNHQYLTKGTYKSILKVWDTNLCFDIDTIIIEVLVEPSNLAEIPNVFTPNGDEINEFLKFDVSGMYSFLFTIYNRWGEKVFQSDDQLFMKETGWDGKTSITKAYVSPGTYFYVIRAIGLDLKSYEKKGSIHVFR